MSSDTISMIKKADIVLAAALLVFCAATAWIAYGLGSEGADITISVDGKLYGTYSLAEDNIIDVDTDYGHNQVTIEAGRAYMSEADCPDGYCLNQHRSQGGISSSNQTLVCLPNKVVVAVEGGDEDGDSSGSLPDAVSGSPAGSKNGGDS